MMTFEQEVEVRLAGLLEDFCGSTVETFADNGIDGRGLILRIIGRDERVQVTISIESADGT